MWRCNLCSLKTSRRGNVIRHIREVHKIDDPNAQNATKDSNTGVKSNVKDKTTKVSNGQQRTIMDTGIPLSEHITDLQYGGHFPRHEPRMDEEDDETRTNPVDGLYSSQEIEKCGGWYEKKKVSHIRLRVGYISWVSED